jgi:hypothetical protein
MVFELHPQALDLNLSLFVSTNVIVEAYISRTHEHSLLNPLSAFRSSVSLQDLHKRPCHRSGSNAIFWPQGRYVQISQAQQRVPCRYDAGRMRLSEEPRQSSVLEPLAQDNAAK